MGTWGRQFLLNTHITRGKVSCNHQASCDLYNKGIIIVPLASGLKSGGVFLGGVCA